MSLVRSFSDFVSKTNCLNFQDYPKGLPRIFTKLLKPVLAKLREEGHTLLIYFDDSLIQGETRELCEEAVARSAELFDSLGFTIHPRKSVFAPTQTIEFLGFVLDSRSMTVSLTHTKSAKLKQRCIDILQTRCSSYSVLS